MEGCYIKEDSTYRFLSNLSSGISDSDTLWVLFEELGYHRCVYILYDEGVINWEFGAEVSSHGIPFDISQYRDHVWGRAGNWY